MTRTAVRAAFLLIGTLCPLFSAAQNAGADRASVEAFFAKYVKLGNGFDVKLADLYSDQAWVHIATPTADGIAVQNMRLSGAQWKQIIPRGMPLARKLNDQDKFTNVRISMEGSTAKIEADRYAVLKCYTDHKYSMRVERQSDGTYLIVEERMRTQEKSDC